MAVSRAFVQLVLALALVPTLATSKQFIVGDEAGWTSGFDYYAWAQDKIFRINDTLVFNYAKGEHNVYRVGQAGFAKCETTVGIVPFTSGHDEILLATAGQKWYICGVPGHCLLGQKLSITVQEPEAPTPLPAPAPAPAQPSQEIP